MLEVKSGKEGDEHLYQPHIHSKYVRLLYRIKLATGLPMTVLVDQAIRELANSYDSSFDLPEEPDTETLPDVPWEEICDYRKLLDEWDLERFESQKESGNLSAFNIINSF